MATLLGIFVVSCRRFVLTFIAVYLISFFCISEVTESIVSRHDERVNKAFFTADELQGMKVSADMAYDYWPSEATPEKTAERNRLRIERYECERDELYLRKGFTPLDTKNVSAESLRRRRQSVEQELFEKFYPKEDIDSVQPEPNHLVSVKTALLFKKAVALIPKDENQIARLKYLREKM